MMGVALLLFGHKAKWFYFAPDPTDHELESQNLFSFKLTISDILL